MRSGVRFLVLVAALVAVVGGATQPGEARAQNTTGGQATSFVGDVTQTGQVLTVRSGGQDRQVLAAQNVTVSRDGRSAALADVRPSDRVVVTLDPNGTAQRIDATSAGTGDFDWRRWALLALLGIPIIGLALWFLGPRGDSFIVESVGPRTAVVTAGPPASADHSTPVVGSSEVAPVSDNLDEMAAKGVVIGARSSEHDER